VDRSFDLGSGVYGRREVRLEVGAAAVAAEGPLPFRHQDGVLLLVPVVRGPHLAPQKSPGGDRAQQESRQAPDRGEDYAAESIVAMDAQPSSHGDFLAGGAA
jgi:hypothetical protein